MVSAGDCKFWHLSRILAPEYLNITKKPQTNPAREHAHPGTLLFLPHPCVCTNVSNSDTCMAGESGDTLCCWGITLSRAPVSTLYIRNEYCQAPGKTCWILSNPLRLWAARESLCVATGYYRNHPIILWPVRVLSYVPATKRGCSASCHARAALLSSHEKILTRGSFHSPPNAGNVAMVPCSVILWFLSLQNATATIL